MLRQETVRALAVVDLARSGRAGRGDRGRRDRDLAQQDRAGAAERSPGQVCRGGPRWHHERAGVSQGGLTDRGGGSARPRRAGASARRDGRHPARRGDHRRQRADLGRRDDHRASSPTWCSTTSAAAAITGAHSPTWLLRSTPRDRARCRSVGSRSAGPRRPRCRSVGRADVGSLQIGWQ